MIIFRRIHTLVYTKKQHVVIQTTSLLMVMGNRLQGFKSICVQMVLIDGIITWNPQSKISRYVEFFFAKTNGQSTNYSFFLLDGLVIYFFCSEIKLEEAAILHYTYTKFSDLTSRRDRCGCKPTKEDVKRCFILEFDRLVSYLFFPLLYLHSIYCCPMGTGHLVNIITVSWLKRWNNTFISFKWYDIKNEMGRKMARWLIILWKCLWKLSWVETISVYTIYACNIFF